MLSKRGETVRKFKILSVCGTGIATSTVAAESCRDMLREKGLGVEVKECKVIEVETNVEMFKPDVIVYTTPLNDKVIKGIKKFSGLPFLTGFGREELINKIAEYLQNMDKQ